MKTLPPYIMIKLTRLNGELFLLNVLTIEQVQSYPDTTITLINGKKFVVKNSQTEVEQLVTQFYQQIGLVGSIQEVGGTDE